MKKEKGKCLVKKKKKKENEKWVTISSYIIDCRKKKLNRVCRSTINIEKGFNTYIGLV